VENLGNHLSRELYFRLLKTAMFNVPIYCDRFWQSLPNPRSIRGGNIVCILLPSNEISYTIFNMRFVFDVSASSLLTSTTPTNRRQQASATRLCRFTYKPADCWIRATLLHRICPLFKGPFLYKWHGGV